MENKTDILDPRDEVRKLQDKVRKLEYQNEQLRSQQSRNGLLGNKIITSISNENCFSQATVHKTIDSELDIIIINDEDFLDEEVWLASVPNSLNNCPKDLQKWLRQVVDSNNDYEFQLMKRRFVHDLDEIERGLRRNNIDTRTYTRSKKRLSRPSLDTMVETPMYENRRQVLSPWKSPHIQNRYDLDDINLTFNNTFASASESLLLNANYHPNDTMEINTLLQKIASDPHINLMPEMKNSTFQKTSSDPNDIHSFQKLCEPDLNVTFLKVSDPCLTANQKSFDLNTTFLLPPRSRSITPSGLNCTFSIQDGSSSSSNRSLRTMSCDSGGDDDQLSSASDSSFSSCNRLMNVGDVQNIARLQEESLKQAVSTPKHNQKREGIFCVEEDLPSPILRDYNHGYQSDHSDHSSSADGRVRSSRSSLKSSPGGSPLGSTQILTHVPESLPCNAVVGMPRRELKLIPAEKQEIPKIQNVTVVKPMDITQENRGRGVSGLRPPAVRSRSGSAGPSRATSQGRGSSIPRPASRIPPPRVRTAYTTQSSGKNWMDGCF